MAIPAALSVPVPSVVFPSINITFPVGIPAAELTVAVNLTDWPRFDGFREEVTLVVLFAFPTVWVKLPVLLAKLLSPL